MGSQIGPDGRWTHFDQTRYDKHFREEENVEEEPLGHECEKCQGRGIFTVEYGPGYQTDYGYAPYERTIECNECKGAGWIEPDED